MKNEKDTKKDLIKSSSNTIKDNKTIPLKAKAVKESTVKKTSAKKTTTKKTNATRKPATKKVEPKKTKSTKVKKTQTSEDVMSNFYQLPYNYNDTKVVLLPQTPNMLYAYWEVSDEYRKNLISKYGENYFEITKPVLRIKNETKGTTFDIELNDFANNWYLHVSDAYTIYSAELYRILKNPKLKNDIPNIHVCTSNTILTPNNRILYTDTFKFLFKDVKTGKITEKRFENVYKNNIYKLYKEMKIVDEYSTLNPSSYSNMSFS